MDITELLRKLECDAVEETRARFLDDFDFYTEVTGQMLRDSGFARLGRQLRCQKARDAFNTAHMLKGIIINCGVTPLYAPIELLTESLRSGSPDYTELTNTYERLMSQRAASRKILLRSISENA